MQPSRDAITPADAAAISQCLSPARISTYVKACDATAAPSELPVAALRLYQWNVQVSAALMVPIHIFEVAIRNAAAEALEAVYGPQWPFEDRLRNELPRTFNRYCPHRDLIQTATEHTLTGGVIAQLKLRFWEQIFTRRFEQRIWKKHLRRVLPNMDHSLPLKDRRGEVRANIEKVRMLRNRVAHHEPIFGRHLAGELEAMRRLVMYRSAELLSWFDSVEDASGFLCTHPLSPPAAAAGANGNKADSLRTVEATTTP
ncbi:hypothetical protein [Mycobacterium paraense]|uniref:hypothetical protein n=1 Tax=Mycobacterium paraense TaxID=767916 RepID=UPI00187E08DC|nr:hypothetical protein [Mycobacterium paraense]